MNPLYGLFNFTFHLGQNYYQSRANTLASHSKIVSLKDLSTDECLSLIEKRSMYQYYVNLLLPKYKKDVEPFSDFHRKLLLHPSSKVFKSYLQSEPKITGWDLDYVSKKCYSHDYEKKDRKIENDLNTNKVCFKRLDKLIKMISLSPGSRTVQPGDLYSNRQDLSPETKTQIIGNVYLSSRYKNNTDCVSWVHELFLKLKMDPIKFNPIHYLMYFSGLSNINNHNMEKIIPLIDVIPKITHDRITMDKVDLETKNSLLNNFLESANIRSIDVPILMDKLKIDEFNGTNALQKCIQKGDYEKTIYLLNYSKINFDKLSRIHLSSPQLITKVIEKMEQTLGYEDTKSILEKRYVAHDVTLEMFKDCGTKEDTDCRNKWNVLLKYMSKFNLNPLDSRGMSPYDFVY